MNENNFTVYWNMPTTNPRAYPPSRNRPILQYDKQEPYYSFLRQKKIYLTNEQKEKIAQFSKMLLDNYLI